MLELETDKYQISDAVMVNQVNPLIGNIKDPLFAMMNMCKESDGGSTADHFVRIATGPPEPMMTDHFVL